MTIKEVSSVIDDISESVHPQYGTTYFVTCMFTDDTVGSAGKKKYEYALELQGLLREAIGVEQDFQLESQGQSKSGRDKFKILGFGTPGGAATYTAPGVQGGGEGAVSKAGERRPPARSPEQIDDIRRAVALKAAAQCVVGTSPQDVLKYADAFLGWLTSEPASSAYASDIPGNTQAGAGSEDRGVEGEGEAPSTPHQHDWQPTGLHGKLKCAGCNEMRDRESVT